MAEYFTGKEICSKFSDLKNDAFSTEDHHFVLIKVDKETLYDAPCAFSSNGRNLVTYQEWESHPENYDDYHTDRLKSMVEYLKKGGKFPPLIVDKNLSLYDGQHRLTAYSMIPTIHEIEVYKEI